MRICEVRAYAVAVPVTRAGHFSKRVVERVENTIVEIRTEEGLTGTGETRGLWSADIVRSRFASAIIGMDAMDRDAIRDVCLPKEPFDFGYPEHLVQRNAYSAIDIALWDIAARHAGKPLYDLLGGAVRERALFCGYAYSDDPNAGYSNAELAAAMAKIAAQQVLETGSDLFEYKIGLHSIEGEIEIAHAVRAAVGPDIGLGVDANMALSLEQACTFLQGVRTVGLANFEEPVANLSEMEALRMRFDVPVSTHCYDADTLVRYPQIDAIVVDPQLVGGITGFLQKIALADNLGKRIWLRARWELGIAWAVFCHLGLAFRQLDRSSQALINWIEDDLVLGDRWYVRDGGVRPPDTPGLGVEIDREALARYEMGS